MSQHMVGRPAVAIAILLLLAASPDTASAQFGKLMKLKNAVSPDSAAKAEAAKQDSIALAAKIAAGDTTPLERSRFSRAVKAAGVASEKFEKVTGVSTKDAALAATGVGAGGLVAKKLGVDPKSIVAKKLGVDPASIGANAISKAMDKGALSKLGGAAPTQSMPDMGELMKMQQAALQGAAKRSGSGVNVNVAPGFTAADAQALAVFQQEMMQVAMAASAGDAAAQARLNRWEAIALKYQPEMERLSVSASASDMKALQRLQEIQVIMLKEWVATGKGKVKVSKP